MKRYLYIVSAALFCAPAFAGAAFATSTRSVAPIFPDRSPDALHSRTASELAMPSPEELDSLVMLMRGDNSRRAFDRFFDDFRRIDPSTENLTSDTPDSVYKSRLAAILSPIGMPWNEIVKPFVISYTTNRRTTMGNVLARSRFYFPIIENELAAAGLPLEFRMLPVIESALVPSARSHMGAMGLWQFMLPTGREYGLEVTTFVDERCDPVASTRAACKYLARLYRIYGDWTLVLAAYNCGPGNVNRAFKRAGEGAKTYWDIYEFLPTETRNYVPLFIASTYAYNYHQLHGISLTSSTLPLAVDTVAVSRLVHLDQIATTLDIPIEMLRTLNPQYIKDIVPALDKTYPIVLPLDRTTHFVGREEEIHAKDSLYLAEYLNPANIDETKAVLTNSATIHRVQKDETLGHIGLKYGVGVSQIKRWNNLKSDRLSIGQRLEILK